MCWFMCMLIRNSLKPRVLRATCEFHFWMPNSMRTKFYLNFIKITINFIFSNCLHNLSKHLALALQPSVSFIIFILFLAVFRERSFYFNLVIYISIYNGYGRGWMCRNVMCLWTLESSSICFMHTMNARLNRWHLNRKFFFLLFFDSSTASHCIVCFFRFIGRLFIIQFSDIFGARSFTASIRRPNEIASLMHDIKRLSKTTRTYFTFLWAFQCFGSW